jgi:hypothetical protein
MEKKPIGRERIPELTSEALCMSDIFQTIDNLQRDICIMFVLNVGAYLLGVITQRNKITRRKE